MRMGAVLLRAASLQLMTTVSKGLLYSTREGSRGCSLAARVLMVPTAPRFRLTLPPAVLPPLLLRDPAGAAAWLCCWVVLSPGVTRCVVLSDGVTCAVLPPLLAALVLLLHLEVGVLGPLGAGGCADTGVPAGAAAASRRAFTCCKAGEGCRG